MRSMLSKHIAWIAFYSLAFVLVNTSVIGRVYAGASAGIPVNAFFSYDKVFEAKISPDGKYLAIGIADDASGADRKYVAVIGATDRKERVRFQVSGDREVMDFWWANSQRLLIATATNNGSLSHASADGGLFAINVDKTNPLQLLGVPSPVTHSGREFGNSFYFKAMIYISHKESNHILVQVQTEPDSPDAAVDVNVDTGEVKVVAISPTKMGGFVADSSGQLRIALGLVYKTGKPQLFYRASDQVKEWKDLSGLYQDIDPAENETMPLGFAPGDKQLYWYARTASGTLGLYVLNPTDMSRKLLFADPQFDIADIFFDQVRPNSYEAVAVETIPGLDVWHVLDPKDHLEKIREALSQAFPGQKIAITSSTEDGTVMVVFVSSDVNPGDYYLLDAQTLKADYLFSSHEDIEPAQMSRMKPVEFKARDGLVLHGYLTVPAAAKGTKLPLIILPHGGPHGIRDVWGWNSEAQFFAYHGYAVLQVNYRGSGGYGMKFQDLGYRHWGTSMQDDLADAVHWAVDADIADPNRICIYGASYGGYAALENDIRFPELYKCAVGYVGVYDLTLMTKYGDVHESAFGRHYLKVVLGRDKGALRSESPVYNANLIEVPVLIAYGGRDVRVVPDNAEELMAAMKVAGKPYQCILEPYEQHGFIKPEHRYALYKQMLQFFDEHIGRDAGKVAAAGNNGVCISP